MPSPYSHPKANCSRRKHPPPDKCVCATHTAKTLPGITEREGFYCWSVLLRGASKATPCRYILEQPWTSIWRREPCSRAPKLTPGKGSQRVQRRGNQDVPCRGCSDQRKPATLLAELFRRAFSEALSATFHHGKQPLTSQGGSLSKQFGAGRAGRATEDTLYGKGAAHALRMSGAPVH